MTMMLDRCRQMRVGALTTENSGDSYDVWSEQSSNIENSPGSTFVFSKIGRIWGLLHFSVDFALRPICSQIVMSPGLLEES